MASVADDVIYEFGPFRLDPIERLLLRDGLVVPLTPKAFDLLVYLVERHGRLVEKQALMTALGRTRSSKKQTSPTTCPRCARCSTMGPTATR
jgi:DNA-binding winged helix-turn-helix (wHTH) protein